MFQELKGVHNVESGYFNVTIKNPFIKTSGCGATGYAAVAKVSDNPEEISFETLLSVFFKTHDPTLLNRQGEVVGTPYRSGIFSASINQKNAAIDIINKLNEERAYLSTIVTEVAPLKNYHKAQSYHQDYFSNNPNKRYCSYVIQPKVEKIQKGS